MNSWIYVHQLVSLSRWDFFKISLSFQDPRLHIVSLMVYMSLVEPVTCFSPMEWGKCDGSSFTWLDCMTCNDDVISCDHMTRSCHSSLASLRRGLSDRKLGGLQGPSSPQLPGVVFCQQLEWAWILSQLRLQMSLQAIWCLAYSLMFLSRASSYTTWRLLSCRTMLFSVCLAPKCYIDGNLFHSDT